MHTLHTRTAQIFRWWAEEGGEIAEETSLWTQGWCPLLQGIARLCCDTRQQRALLVHDLQTLNGPEWEACFQRVLFPLLSELLLPIKAHDIQAVEETRMRAATLLSKVFLHHFTSLLSLPTFASLWLTILDYMDKYMHADYSDLLYEAIPESLKNILLVMDSAKVFEEQQPPAQLWAITWERITKFLPHMKEELFREKDVAEVKDEQPLEQHQPQLVQHNIENATKASIILQPPLSEQNIASSLFAHLGQMVSTPIGAPTTNETSHTTAPFKQASTTIVDLPTIPVIPTAQPHLQLELQNHQPSPPLTQQTVIYENVPNSNNLLINNTLNQDHQTMPILSPISLYTEYVENPYNDLLSEPLSNHNANIQNRNGIFNLQSQENVFNNENQSRTEENIFQSSQYFCSDSNADFIPSSSEIFSSLQPQLINSQSINIPQLVNNLNIVTSSTE